MIVKLDDNVILELSGPITTLTDLIEVLETRPELQTRVIESIIVDGKEIEDVYDIPPVDLHPDSELHVFTKPIVHLLLETATTCQDYLPRLRAASVLAATRLHESRETDAFYLIRDLVGGLHWYTEFLGHVGTLHSPEKEQASNRLAALNDILKEILVSWQREDFTLLADLLEYELTMEIEAGIEYVGRLLTNLSASLGNGK